MNDISSNLNTLTGSLTSAQGSLTEMQGAVIQIQQQVNDIIVKGTQVQADVAIAAISMRDHIVLLLAQWGVTPTWVPGRISGFQLQKDDNDQYIRDAKGNFVIQ